MNDIARRAKEDKNNINKYEIARTILQRINEEGNSGLRARREIIKRVVEFENFSTCWPDDQLKAKGLVSEIRKVVDVKDSFTLMNQERAREKLERIAAKEEKIASQKQKIQKIENLKKNLSALFTLFLYMKF